MASETMIEGTGPADGKALEPVRCTPVGSVPRIVGEVRERAARHAERSLEERARLVSKLKNAVLARGDAIVRTLCSESGKVEAEAWSVDVLPTADLGAYWALEGATRLAAEDVALDPLSYPGKRARVERVARGVIGLITPWNFPVAIPLRTIFPALLAGNGVVMKPSEHAPRVAVLIEEAVAEVYGEGLLRIVQGGGEVGAALIGAGVDAICFTGSVATGRKVAHAAADALVPVALELGGKDAALVLDDADVERAANGILWAALANAGQNCAAIERVYATPKVAKALVERMTALAKDLAPGRDFGPLTTAAQLETVERHVADAKKGGAKVAVGGERLDRPGLWFAPTILSDVRRDAPLAVDETFGPVVPVFEVADEQAAVAAANESRYGLTASVWSKNLARAEEVARRLRVGVVTINNHAFTGAVPSLPWTGVRESGYGVTNSPHALDILTRPRTILVDRSRAKREMWWFPYTPALVGVLRAMSTLRGGAGIGAKVRALFQVIGGFARRWKLS